jgi:DNA-binding response OmpR family regulator
LSAHKPRVLVIDDEPQIHRFLGPALDAAGYEHVRAETASEGLREIARKAPDVVVLDLGLPDMDGKQARRTGSSSPQQRGREASEDAEERTGAADGIAARAG